MIDTKRVLEMTASMEREATFRDYEEEIQAMRGMAEELDRRREDDANAADEMSVPIPEPGSDLGRVMSFEILRLEADGLRKEHHKRLELLAEMQEIRAAQDAEVGRLKKLVFDLELQDDCRKKEAERLLDVLRERHDGEDADKCICDYCEAIAACEETE